MLKIKKTDSILLMKIEEKTSSHPKYFQNTYYKILATDGFSVCETYVDETFDNFKDWQPIIKDMIEENTLYLIDNCRQIYNKRRKQNEEVELYRPLLNADSKINFLQRHTINEAYDIYGDSLATLLEDEEQRVDELRRGTKAVIFDKLFEEQ